METMESIKQVEKAEVDMTNDSSKDTIDPELKAKSYLPFKQFHSNSTSMSQRRDPSENSLAWFMLRYGPLIPRPDPQPVDSSSKADGSSRSTGLLPAGVVPLDFDLDAEVYNFAMNYDNIQCIPREYWTPKWRGPSTESEAELQRFLHDHLWRDVNIALESAPDLPYYVYYVIRTVCEDASIRKVIAGPGKIRPKVAILELETPSSLTSLDFMALCSQQPSSASAQNQKILSQVYRYFKDARVTWGAISNGLSTVFVRYEPNTKIFAMSDIIPHEHPAIIGYYCYWARLSDLQRIDHPRRSLFLPQAVGKNNSGTRQCQTKPKPNVDKNFDSKETQNDRNANNDATF